ncbi:alpha/beta fold hydrolase [Lysobacter niastensis]|uniref:Alpha/beta hydrolase n=1 Tax=Lysobacter niastensis TaxID=380629 RepID=A0ABS0BAM0_9GAMM|nr:alpha/beta hydrolase [Lysobacter niastensis]MBF6026036.1 alpha/beta hydrolase [Lysobacter niastensis]
MKAGKSRWQALALCALVSSSAMAASDAGDATSKPALPQPDPALDVYAQAARLVDIGGGRRLNLRCNGPEAATTVVLEAGFGADSLSWSRLQPLLAGSMRVCSYDRAGYGFSDGGPLPRDIDAEVADLHALVRAASLRAPFVLVGHSLGSNIARLYDRQHPQDVAALVLVDPPPQGIAAFSPEYQAREKAMLPQMLKAYRDCEQGAKAGTLAKDPPPELKACLRGPDPRYSDRLNAAIRESKLRPGFWDTVISGSEAKAALFEPSVSGSERHGSKPLVVLSAVDAYAGAPPPIRDALQPAQAATHRALVATSSRGRLVEVKGSTHDIQMDQPGIVADAVRSVIASP